MTTRLQIEAAPLFNFQQSLSYMKRSANECMYQLDEDAVRCALVVQGQELILEIRQAASCASALEATVLKGSVTAAMKDELVRYVCDWLDLDADLAAFYQHAAADPLLSQLITRFPGLTIVGIPDLFEALCWGIIGQQINLSFAYTLKRRLVEEYGRAVADGNDKCWLFPKPEIIAELSVGQLTGLQLTKRKSEYLIHIAELIANGKLSKPALLEDGSLQAAEQMLLGIRGIGPWTANYVLMRCLRFGRALPADDVGLHLAVKHLLNLESKPSRQEVLKLAAAWAPWEAYATFYLWRLLY